VDPHKDLAVVRPGFLPGDYVPVHALPSVCMHSEAGILLVSDPEAITAEMKARTASFRTRAVEQSFAPASLVASVTEDDLVNEHGDEVITVLVMSLSAIPAPMADLLREQPIAGPIPAWVSDDARDHRTLKQIQQGFVVHVAGSFTRADIGMFASSLDLDVDGINALLDT
jgi:hypothetical protein